MASEREILLDRIEKTAHEYEKKFHGCSRCVFKSLQDHLGLGDGSAFKAATPLAAGIAMRGETCGALLGGLMALGVVTASEDMSDENAQFESLGAAFRLARKVEKEFGTIRCRELQAEKLGRFFNLADPADYQAFAEAGGYVECPKVAGKVARMTGEFILNYLDKKAGDGQNASF